MWYESPIYFFIVTGLYIAASWYDIYSSRSTAWHYGIYEANKFARDADGEFSLKKNLIAKVGLLAVNAVIGLATHSWGAACAILIIPAIVLPFVALNNFKKARYGREQQNKILDVIRNGGSIVQPTFITQNNKTFSSLFHWLYVPFDGDYTSSANKAFDRVQEFAKSGANFPK
jgi:hypothetical protein